MSRIKVEDEDGLRAGTVTPQYQPNPPQEIPLWLHLERGDEGAPAEPECPVLAHLDPGEAQSLVRPACRCPAPSLLVTTADPRRPDPKPRRTSLRDVPKWYQCPGGWVVRLSYAPQSDGPRVHHHGRWKYGKLVLLLHGLDAARLGEDDDLAQVYWEQRRRGGAAPKAALVKSWTGSAAASAGENEVYLEPVAPGSEAEPPSLQLVYAGGNAAAECYECARAEERQRVGVAVGSDAGVGRSNSVSGGASAPAVAVAPPASMVPAASMVGNNILSRLLDRHNRWPFGGLAEILHNSADADAERVSIVMFPKPGAKPDDCDFALQIDDDGRGMDHADMVRMMRIGADEAIGRADKVGKIGGYGVGFKAGTLATAHTAVVLSSCLAKRTVSVGLLSNEPYEARQERPHVGLVATQCADTARVDEATTTVEGREEILKLIAKTNPSLTRERIALWSGQMNGKSGTTVFLCGVRRNPDLPERMLYEFDTGSGSGSGEKGQGNNKPDLRFLAPGSKDQPFDEFSGRFDGQVAPMDHSFRAYLGLMFKGAKPEISLFGEDVEQHVLSEELVDKKVVDLGSGVTAVVGCHPPSVSLPMPLSGAMLYCEGVLVESYARREFEIPRDDRDLGALLVADLPKSTSESRTVHDSGFKPKDHKLSFDWSGKKEFRRRLKAEFLKYEDHAMAERDRRNPLRTALRKFVTTFKEELVRKYGPNSAGSMIGLLRLPLREEADEGGAGGSATHQSYFQAVEKPISLHELSERIEAKRYVGVGALAAFVGDLKQIFRNIRQWHSKCRWHPDNDVDDLALLSNAEDGYADAKPFHTTERVYTIQAICKFRNIPDAFYSAMVENNSEYGDIDVSKTEFKVGTTILVPHHLDVAAFKDAKELKKCALKQLKATEQILLRAERAKQGGVKECWLQCDRKGCYKWRCVTEEYQQRFQGTDTTWTCDAEGSPVDGCHVPEGRRPDDLLAVHAAAGSSGSPPRAEEAEKEAPSGKVAGAKRSKSRGSSKRLRRTSGGSGGTNPGGRAKSGKRPRQGH